MKKIEVTPEERTRAALAAQKAVKKGMRHYGVVTAVLKAINEGRDDE